MFVFIRAKHGVNHMAGTWRLWLSEIMRGSYSLVLFCLNSSFLKWGFTRNHKRVLFTWMHAQTSGKCLTHAASVYCWALCQPDYLSRFNIAGYQSNSAHSATFWPLTDCSLLPLTSITRCTLFIQLKDFCSLCKNTFSAGQKCAYIGLNVKIDFGLFFLVLRLKRL